MRRWGAIPTTLVALGWAAPGEASPGESFGSGARSQSLAGTGVAHASGYAATTINPARLDPNGPPTFALGFQAQNFQLNIDRLFAKPGSSGAELSPLPDGLSDATQAAIVGVSVPLELGGALRQRLALGLAVSAPSATIVRVRILNSGRPQFPLLSTRSETLNLNVGFSARLSDTLSLGIGSAFLADLNGEIQIDAGSSGKVTSVTDDELTIVAAPIFALNWQVTQSFTVGAVWRQPLVSEFALKVTLDGLGQVIVPPLNITGLAQADPGQLHLESAFAFGHWLLALGVSLKRWSEFERLKDATITCPADAPDCAAPPATDIAFSSTVVPRVAGSYELDLTHAAKASIRVGYFLEPSPLGHSDPGLRLFDNHRHVLTAGYGFIYSGRVPFAINLATQLHVLSRREYDLDDGSGRSFQAQTSGNVWAYALDMEVPF